MPINSIMKDVPLVSASDVMGDGCSKADHFVTSGHSPLSIGRKAWSPGMVASSL
jgi:hypothetical protein